MVELPFDWFFQCIFVVENRYHIIFYMFQVQFDFPDEYLDLKLIETNSEKKNFIQFNKNNIYLLFVILVVF
jgi:hypothetical protein